MRTALLALLLLARAAWADGALLSSGDGTALLAETQAAHVRLGPAIGQMLQVDRPGAGIIRVYDTALLGQLLNWTLPIRDPDMDHRVCYGGAPWTTCTPWIDTAGYTTITGLAPGQVCFRSQWRNNETVAESAKSNNGTGPDGSCCFTVY